MKIHNFQKEIVYLNHRKNGVEINYSEEGVIITSTTWESDVKNGEEIRYFESGEIQHVTYFTEGKKDGKCRQYAIDGRIIAFKTYKKGVIFSTEKGLIDSIAREKKQVFGRSFLKAL